MNDGWILLPVIAFILAVLFYRVKLLSSGWRVAGVLSAVTLTAVAIFFVEAASIFSGLNSFTVRIFWLALILLFWFMLLRRLKRQKLFFSAFPKLGFLECLLLGAAAIIFLVNAFVAFVAPPNNWDSMTYHLPRIMHWAANGNVKFFPTYIERQLFYPPGAEFCLLHLHLLTGGDRWLNFLQLFSWAGVGVTVSLIAGLLGAGRGGQILAGIVAVTTPMAVLQSTSTQNDLFVSLWISVVIALGLLWQVRPARTTIWAMAAALGISILVKGTFFIVIPFLIWMAVRTWKRFFRYLPLLLGFIILLSAGHASRVWSWQGRHSLLNDQQSALLMPRKDPAAVVVNAVCQMVTGLMTPFFTVDMFLENVALKTSLFLGIDSGTPDLFGTSFSAISDPLLLYDEDYAPAPLRTILILILPLLLGFSRPHARSWAYYFCWLAGWLLFFMIVRWQPWITRLHLPLMILAAPLIGVSLGHSKWLTAFLGVPLLAIAFWTMASHQTRPLTGENRILVGHRDLHYFVKKPEQALAFLKTATSIRTSGCRDVGLIEGGDSWEYPLWALTGSGTVKFRSIDLAAGVDEQAPCLLVTLDRHKEDILKVTSGVFLKAWEESPLQVYVFVR